MQLGGECIYGLGGEYIGASRVVHVCSFEGSTYRDLGASAHMSVEGSGYTGFEENARSSLVGVHIRIGAWWGVHVVGIEGECL